MAFTNHTEETINIVRSFSSFTTLLLIICLYNWYSIDFEFIQLNHVYLIDAQFWTSQKIHWFIIEVCICLIHEPPYIDHDVDMALIDRDTGQYDQPIYVRNPW